MTSKKIFEDGSCVEWKDRETLLYKEGERSASIWVDFEPGWFKSGRIIKTDSVEYWDDLSGTGKVKIDQNKKQEIIDKVILYYKGFGKKVIVH
ncbi:hypothetical protein [Teredinibacter turnerae]|uniref:hypothetical protein n=1 Tax=Teredinibacter turnerae TaxID=2426 RepID=UPI000375C774|nr:hypothetical protein [Teredinibacter turnerae]